MTAEFVSDLPVSRSIVDRDPHELERVGFVETRGTVHCSTLVGRMALETYSQFVECLDDIDVAAAVLDALDSDTPLASVLLGGCEAVPIADGGLGPMLLKLTSFVEEAESVCGCVQGVFPSQIDVYYRVVVSDGTPVDIAVTDDVAQRLVTAYRPQLAEMWSVDSFSFRPTAVFPYSPAISDLPDDPVVFLVAYSERSLVGIIYNDSRLAVSWASRRIEDWRSDAPPFPRLPGDEF